MMDGGVNTARQERLVCRCKIADPTVVTFFAKDVDFTPILRCNKPAYSKLSDYSFLHRIIEYF